MGINLNQISTIDDTGSSAQEGSVILSKNNGDNLWSSNSTASLILPVGTTAQRDASPNTGRLRLNTDLSTPELSLNGIWKAAGQMNIAGSIVAPGISFVNDANTGLFWLSNSGSKQIGISVDSSARTTWTSSQMEVLTPMVTRNITSTGLNFASYSGSTVGLTVTIPNSTSGTLLYNTNTQAWVANTRIKVSVAPVDNDDVANKAYVDAAITGGGQATTSSYGSVKLATLSQAIAGTAGVVPTADVAKNALNSLLDTRFGSNNSLVWNPNNDGAGSGLDADLLDGQQGTYYASAASVGGKVDKAGDTMTGFLTLSANPTAILHASTKQYTDTKLALSGGTLTGPLILASDPSSALQASTKQYTDTKVSKSGDSMTGFLTLSANPTSGLHAATKQYVDSASSPSTIISGLQSVDGSGSGLDADLLDGQHGSYYASAASLNGKVSKTGDTMTGDLIINSGNGYISLGTNGDITARRSNGSGVIFLGSSGSKYLFHDNSNYIMPGSNLYVNGGLAWHSNNDGSGSGLDADLLDGLHASDFITSSSFGSNSLATNGYQILPNGLILQWGTASGASYKAYPIAFPNACLMIAASNRDSQGDRVDNAFAYQVDNTQFYSACKSSGTNGISGYGHEWFAIGY